MPPFDRTYPPRAPSRASVDLEAAARAIDAFLAALGHSAGENPELRGTGARVAEAFAKDLLQGYAKDPRELLRNEVLPLRATSTQVQVAPISLTTVCPHHLLVAEGTASVTFVGKTLVGVGAVVAAVHAASRRLVLQEELSESLADIFFDVLSADSVEVEIALKHGCMRHRGERAEGTTVRTVATRTRATKGDP